MDISLAELEQAIRNLVLLLGGWTVVVTAVAVWISNLATNRLMKSWDTKYERELELLRNTLSNERLQLEHLFSTLSSEQTLAQKRRLEAVDELWKSVVKLRDHFSPAIFFFSILHPDEYQNALTKSNMAAAISQIDDEFFVTGADMVASLESQRPYLGETLWLRFFIYRAFVGRLAVLITQIKDGRSIDDWRKDPGVQQHLSSILTKEEWASLKQASPFDVHYALNLLEAKLLEEISYVLSGRRSSLESFENAQDLRQMLIKEKLPGI